VVPDSKDDESSDEFWTSHMQGGIRQQDAAGDEVVHAHPEGGQVLLDGSDLVLLAELLDIGRDVKRLDVIEVAQAVLL